MFCQTAAGLRSRGSRDNKFGYIARDLAQHSPLRTLEAEESYLWKYNVTIKFQKKISLLSRPVHSLSDQNLAKLYENAIKTHERDGSFFHL